ncbi:uncharacterized protein CYBJADRAFT_52174 [Cyberlindnera jadinii NRRL Y-1542]|uniref:Uncharacterized protein n=1 Tax=Cyberlindnera jadinii (strain ATCC 18201 / CBS 1600 / BCRC 20928 / JCM 3617 / NBRC 0987 / NRRL Y-1542) TaxID=983966 RepID=A0A1E4RV50_CYBJN|nr:hypothetical protein CYBJADRAFT_52174 [Cyberlindnera jadinii NRRL Y-1542]ODV71144.1 hypothetical protein CYBJADRAFT_52174 [Cyberlindnera jadinii NRRL Y-1542]
MRYRFLVSPLHSRSCLKIVLFWSAMALSRMTNFICFIIIDYLFTIFCVNKSVKPETTIGQSCHVCLHCMGSIIRVDCGYYERDRDLHHY